MSISSSAKNIQNLEPRSNFQRAEEIQLINDTVRAMKSRDVQIQQALKAYHQYKQIKPIRTHLGVLEAKQNKDEHRLIITLITAKTKKELITLNASAFEIWRLLDGHHSLEQIVDHLAAVFKSSDLVRIALDVSVFVNKLGRLGLISGVITE